MKEVWSEARVYNWLDQEVRLLRKSWHLVDLRWEVGSETAMLTSQRRHCVNSQ